MSIILAEVNDNNICIGVKQVNSMIDDGKHIEIPDADFDTYAWKKYDFDTQTWSGEKFEPQTTAPLTEFEQMKATVDQLVIDSLGGI